MIYFRNKLLSVLAVFAITFVSHAMEQDLKETSELTYDNLKSRIERLTLTKTGVLSDSTLIDNMNEWVAHTSGIPSPFIQSLLSHSLRLQTPHSKILEMAQWIRNLMVQKDCPHISVKTYITVETQELENESRVIVHTLYAIALEKIAELKKNTEK